jgi:adenylate kinase family enzyme
MSYQLIILFGPPSVGKGTHARMMAKDLGAEYLDIGERLRHLNNIEISEELKDAVNTAMHNGVPVPTDIFLDIYTQTLESKLINNHILVVDRPGSLSIEAETISNWINIHKINTLFVHLRLDIDESILRATNRWFVKDSPIAYKNKHEAEKASSGKIVYQREDDTNVDTIKNRYDILYSSRITETINIYKQNRFVTIVELNGGGDIDKVHEQILQYIHD